MMKESLFWQNVRIAAGLLPNPRRWPMVFRMGSAYLRVALQNQRPFRFFDVALHYGCNLTCEHCSASPMMRPRAELLNHDEYRRFVDDAMRYGAMAFHLTGGEPLMRSDVFDIIKIFKPNWNMVSIQTNGLLLTEPTADRLQDAGVRMIGISIDSADPAEHDRFRGHKGTFDAALAALDRARARGMVCAISICVSHENLRSDGVLRLIELIGEKGAKGFLNLAVPIGRWAGRWDLMITDEDRDYINELIAKYPYIRTDFETNWRERGCSAMKEKAYLTPYGDVIPCPFIQVSYGNIRDMALADIIQRGATSEELRGYPPRCLASQDREFVQRFRCYHPGCERLPVPRDEAEIVPEATVAEPSVACSTCACATPLETCQTP